MRGAVAGWDDSMSLCTLWPFPLMWWLTGGRWWSVLGSPLAFGLSLTFRTPFWATSTTLVLLRQCCVWLPWWGTILATVLGILVIIFFTVESQGGQREPGAYSPPH